MWATSGRYAKDFADRPKVLVLEADYEQVCRLLVNEGDVRLQLHHTVRVRCPLDSMHDFRQMVSGAFRLETGAETVPNVVG